MLKPVRSLIVKLGTLTFINLIPWSLSFLSVPIIIRTNSLEVWTQIILCQTLGSSVAIVSNLGWNYLFPNIIAKSDRDEKLNLFVISIIQRTLASSVALLIGSIVLYSVFEPKPQYWFAFFATSIYGLNSNTVFQGEFKPNKALFWDVLPRSFLQLVAILVLISKNNLALYLFLVFLSQLVTLCIVNVKIYRDLKLASRQNLKSALITSLRKFSLTKFYFLPSISSHLYTTALVPIVALLFPHELSTFALSYKICQLLFGIFNPVLQGIQGVVNHSTDKNRSLRISGIVLFYITAVYSLVCWFTIPILVSIFTGRTSFFDSTLRFLISLTVASLILSVHIGLTGLHYIDKREILFISTIIGALVGVGGLFILSLNSGTTGVFFAYALSEVAVLTTQLRYYLPRLRKQLKEVSI